MSLDNDKNNQDFNEFLQSLQNDDGADALSASAGKEEAFPFADTFDIDSFVKENGIASAEARAEEPKQPSNPAPAKEEYVSSAPRLPEEPSFKDETSSYRYNADADEIPSYRDDYARASYADSSFEGGQSLRHLEQKISELESSFVDVNKEKSYFSGLQREIEDIDSEEKQSFKGNDEFYKNMSATIETLKGSLKAISNSNRTSVLNDISVLRGSIDNIVNARLQYEENLINQDQTLINRLREKTNRLKSINLALNSEVKRAKNEKLESLRKSAEQTKELLSLRVQLNKVEEKARHGDFKLSRMEQHLSILNQEKVALDEEIRKVREEKLSSIRKSSEQAKEIMSLRLALSKTEEKFKQEEIQNSFLREQLSGLEAAKASLDKEVYSTRAEREAAKREVSAQSVEIEKLKRNIAQSQELLNLSANEAGGLREKILSLETKLQQMHGENAALSLRTEENLKQLEAARAQHEREIASLKNEQMREIELLKNQKAQEAQSITLELRRAEDKYRQEETFVNTLKLQIESLRNDVKNLDEQKRGLEGKSTDLYREIEFIKEGHLQEIEALRAELTSASEKLSREQSQYQALKQSLSALESEKAALNEEIRKILSEKDEALAANEKYIKDIESLKSEHAALESSLKAELDKMNARHERDLAAYNELKAQEEALRRENAGYQSQITEISAREEGLKREKAGYEAQIGEFIAREEDYKKAGADYEARINALLTGEEAAKKANAEYLAKIAELESKKEEILKEKSSFELELKGKEETFSKELSEYQSRIKALETEQAAAVTNLSIEIQNLKKEHAGTVSALSGEASALRGEKDRLSAEIDSLKAALTGKDEESRRLGEEISSLQAGINAGNEEKLRLGKSIENLMRDISARNEEKQNLSAEMDALRAEISSKNEETARLNAEIEGLRNDISERDAAAVKLNGEIETLRSSAAASERRAANMTGEIEHLKAQLEEQKRANADIYALFENVKAENAKHIGEIESAKALNSASESKIADITSALLRAETIVRENENIINMLKGEASAAASQKAAIDEELKKANGEKYDILKQLEEKTKALADFQQRYEDEVAALKETHGKAAADYEEKLKAAQERLSTETQTVEELKRQIAGLEQEKNSLSSKVSDLDLKAGKIVEQTDEIIILKSQLAKAESRFLQDTVLVDQLKAQFSESRETVARLENEILTLRKENAKAKEDLALKEEEIQKLTAALAKSEEQVKQEHSAVEQLQEHTSQLKSVNAALDAEVKKAQGEKLEALRKSADQAKEILLLRQQLSQAESKFSSLDFENGIVSVRKEYEEKVEKLETELKDASALCAKQVKELEELKTDNSRLKSAEEEKLKLQNSYDVLSQKAQSLENELASYKQKEASASTLAKAKAAALSAQIAKITKEKAALKQQLDGALKEIERLTAKEKETAEALNSLKAKISDNDAVIEKLKKEIVVLTAENRELKQAAEVTNKRERALASKLDEVEEENKNLATSLNLAKEDAAKTEITLNKIRTDQARAAAKAAMERRKTMPPQAPAAPQPAKPQPPVAEAAKTISPKTETVPAAAKTATALPAEKTSTHYDSSADAIAAFAEPMQNLEEVEVDGNEMDLSMIFGDGDVSFKEEDADTMATATNPDIEAVKATTIKQSTNPLAKVQDGLKAYDEMEVTDHSVKAHGGVSRKPVGRLPPTYRGSEAYSDFLKKTKSVFYRIKWSLFKE
ncbi:hypothetical protein [Candidatus Proelusimicrobium excrementi]|uniref:hypothetical protein n=1 Tax=Candidatus Proelusimicrobium excrementi TaxID=3416222 RepID=UPI003C807907|nr:hypothetical protein [Elusimicrobiaceae bacterium]